jgi:hypothetical protein
MICCQTVSTIKIYDYEFILKDSYKTKEEALKAYINQCDILTLYSEELENQINLSDGKKIIVINTKKIKKSLK